MNLPQLAERIAASQELSKSKARAVIEAVFAAVIEAASAGDEVVLAGIGRFRVQDVPERQGRNPATGETMTMPASRRLAFTPAKAIRDAVKGGATSV